MKSNNFRDQVAFVTSWFKDWNECEQTVALYSLLKKSSPIQAKFLDQVLQQSLAECTAVKQLEAEANDEAYVRSLYSQEKEHVIRRLLQLLPLLQVGKNSVKKAYLQLIPELLSHTIQNGVNIEESRQLLSYSLIHPAITMEERGNFQTWLGCLEERFSSNVAHSGSSTAPSSSSGSNSLSVGHSQSHSPSPGSSSQHSITLLSPDLSVSQEYINVATNQCMPPHGHSSPSPITGSGTHNSWQQPVQGHYANFDASAAINPPPPAPNGDTSGCAQYVAISNGHLGLRATNSHAGAYGASQGKPPLQARSSAPPKFTSMQPSGSSPQGPANNQNTHPLLRRTPSIPPGRLHNSEKAVYDWLKTNHNHQQQQIPHSQPHPILASRAPYADHAPLSPQSSVTSSGSGGSDSHHEEGPQPTRDSFLEEGSGMREVPVWLKTLRLHKYSYLFRQMTYEEMLNVTEEWLEQQNVTKGARHKIYISIVKLRERQEVLRKLEKKIVNEGGSIKSALGEMKTMLNTPIKAYMPTQSLTSSINHPAYRTSSPPPPPTTTTSVSSSHFPQSPSSDEVEECDLPAQFCRLMGKVCTQLLVASRPDDECFQIYLQLIDKCLNHEAFSRRQKNLLQTWKQSAQRIWQPPPQKYGDRPRRVTGAPLSSRIIPWSSRGSGQMSVYPQGSLGSLQLRNFGKRSIVGGGAGGNCGHFQLTRNSSLNPSYFNKPGLLEVGEQQTKQPLSRTQSAPTHRPLVLPLQGCETANDTEINARLDSLCISMTEHALGSSDNNDRGSPY